MPRTIGDKVPERLSFSFTPINLRDAELAMRNKEFPNVANLINTALRFYFENRNKTERQAIKEFMESSEGEELFKKSFKKYEESVSKNKESPE
jgi:hypothetical protein